MKAATNRVSKQYPRSLPFRAPEDLQPRLSNLRHWNIMLVVISSALFVAVVASGVVMMNRPHSTIEEPTASSAPPLVSAFSLPSRQEPTSDLAKEKAVPAKADAGPREAFLEALGGLSAVHLYQSYLNIGLVADAVEKEVYTVAEAGKILKTVEDLIGLVDQRLTHLAKTSLDQDDLQALEHIRTVTEQLRLQASALKGFWAAGETENMNRYRQARARCWDELRDLLGID
jgi:hypothetical protein